jgi:hypothetical protein
MKIYHRILTDEEPGYRNALLVAYQEFLNAGKAAK